MKICLSEPMAESIGTDIAHVAPDAEVVVLRPDGTYAGNSREIDTFLFSVDLSMDKPSLAEAWRLLRADTLRWVQGPGAGVEMPIWTELVERGVLLTNAAGVHAEPIAQYVMTYVLHWSRQVARHQRQQRDHEWVPVVADDLTAATLGIVGFGGIGRATARVAKGFGMRVLALRRSEIDDPNVDEAYGPDGLMSLLAESDFVVLALPLTAATEHLIDAAAIAAMGETAVLINVARGAVVDQPALIAALERSAIRGATLDVTVQEPLPPDSPLWDLDNCVLTPHDAGYSPRAGERLGRLFLDNLERRVAGAAMINQVRPEDIR